MFGKAWRVPFRLMGIPLLLDWSLLIVLPLFTWTIGNGIKRGAEPMGLGLDLTALRSGATPYVIGLIVVVGLFLSVVIHELGHAITARLYGVRTRSITLWLLGGVAQLEQIPRQRGAEAIVAIVGPIVSLALGGLCLVGLAFVPASLVAAQFVFMYLARINFMLAIFNLLPALPLDGGRVVRSLLAARMDPLRATQIAGRISKVLAVALGLLGILANPWLLFIAFFIYLAVNAETQQTLIEHLLAGVRVRELMNPRVVSVPPHVTAGELTQLMFRERHLGFPVVDESGRLLGIIELSALNGVPPDVPVSQVMSSDVRTIADSAPALEAFNKMARSGFARLIVVDDSRRMVGILCKSDLMRAIQIRAAALAPHREAVTPAAASDVLPHEEGEVRPAHPIV
jgi:Zn-dependent protease/CBS domain-containing protein